MSTVWTTDAPQPLGRRVPTDFEHLDRWPLRALAIRDQPVRFPVVIGVNWFEAFDHPVKGKDGLWRVNGPLGRVRGGHCVCLKPNRVNDPASWWTFYNQVGGSCVGHGSSRAMSLLNRLRYDAPWLYHAAQAIDEWADTPPEEGTSVRAGMEVLRTLGHVRTGGRRIRPVNPADGIAAYRWAESIDEVQRVLGYPNADELPVLNSWGRGYPHVTWFPCETLDRLRRDDGEFAIVTDK